MTGLIVGAAAATAVVFAGPLTFSLGLQTVIAVGLVYTMFVDKKYKSDSAYSFKLGNF